MGVGVGEEQSLRAPLLTQQRRRRVGPLAREGLHHRERSRDLVDVTEERTIDACVRGVSARVSAASSMCVSPLRSSSPRRRERRVRRPARAARRARGDWTARSGVEWSHRIDQDRIARRPDGRGREGGAGEDERERGHRFTGTSTRWSRRRHLPVRSRPMRLSGVGSDASV